MGNKFDLLNKILDEQNGIINTKMITAAGIPRDYLSQMVSAGKLERVGRGEYIAAGSFDDLLFRLQSKYKRSIFSHETSLLLHDLSDRDPLINTVTVPSGYNASKLKTFPAAVYYIGKDLFDIGTEELVTDFGHPIKCYNSERTICDVIRNRKTSDIADISNALKRYTSQKGKNIPKLMEYAAIFRITKLLRSYLEVLL